MSIHSLCIYSLLICGLLCGQINDAVYDFARVWNEYWTKRHDDYSDHFEITFYSERLLDDEVSRTATGDIPTFIAAIVWMLIYLMCTLGKLSCIGARPWLALSAVFILLGALIIGFTISLCLGVPFNPVVMLVSFILLGVGVDDMS